MGKLEMFDNKIKFPFKLDKPIKFKRYWGGPIVECEIVHAYILQFGKDAPREQWTEYYLITHATRDDGEEEYFLISRYANHSRKRVEYHGNDLDEVIGYLDRTVKMTKEGYKICNFIQIQ